jgi:hypothetical protein
MCPVRVRESVPFKPDHTLILSSDAPENTHRPSLPTASVLMAPNCLDTSRERGRMAPHA